MSRSRFAHVLVALLTCLFMMAATSQAQTTWYVDDDAPNDPGPGDPNVSDPLEDGSPEHPFDAIQEGIDAASNGDTVLVLDGTYTSDGNRDLDFGGRLITLRSENGPEGSIIDCQANWPDLHRGLHFHTGETADAVVDGFTIQNGGYGWGGGIYCHESSPTVTNCTFVDNEADSGGGGMYNEDSSPTVINCTFIANTVTYTCSGIGGGMYNEGGSPTVTDCVFVGNTATHGGGMWNHESSPTLTNCVFLGNHADGCWYHNYPGYGGGMYNRGSSPTVTNCTFSGNGVSRGTGGGIYNDNSSPTVANCTFSGNTADDAGGGMYSEDDSSPTVANCIMRDDTPGEIDGPALVTYSDVEGGWPGEGNIDDDPLFAGGPFGTWTADGVYDPQTYQVTFTDANASWSEGELVGKFISPDLLHEWNSFIQLPIIANTATTLTVWADRGTIFWGASWVASGATYQIHDYHLTAGSPCIDAGDNTAVPDWLLTDLDGNPRFWDDRRTSDTGNPDGIHPIVDMGPYEFGSEGCPDDDGDGFVTICHIPPGHPERARTITVSVWAAAAHLAHGDYCGPCNGEGEGEAAPTGHSVTGAEASLAECAEHAP